MIEGVWGAERPITIGAALNVHLSKIRKLLAAAGPDATLVTEPHGYALRVDPERLDVHRFEGLVREGREALMAGRAKEAAATLDRALALWRGPPLDELALDGSVEACSPVSASCVCPRSRPASKQGSRSAGTPSWSQSSRSSSGSIPCASAPGLS